MHPECVSSLEERKQNRMKCQGVDETLNWAGW